MILRKISFKVLLTLLLLTAVSFKTLAVDRIENFEINRKKVKPLYMALAKATVIRFEDSIEKVRIGASQYYEYEVDETNPKEIALIRSKHVDVPTNLILRTTKGDIFVFDLVPSERNHQDVVYVDRSFYKKNKKFSQKNKRKRNRERIFLKDSRKFLFSSFKNRKNLDHNLLNKKEKIVGLSLKERKKLREESQRLSNKRLRIKLFSLKKRKRVY